MVEKFIQKPHHVAISVPNLESSVLWYRDMLGFTEVQRSQIEAIPARIAFMEYAGFRIELFEVKGSQPLSENRRIPNLDPLVQGTKHIALEIKGLPAFLELLKKQGVDIAMDFSKIDNVSFAFIRDNSGILIELIEPLDYS